MGQLDEAPLASLARAAEPRIEEFKAQHLANTVRGAVGQLNEAPFAALARAAKPRLDKFNA